MNRNLITPTVSERKSRLVRAMEFEETARLLPTPAVFIDTDYDPSPRLTRAIFLISSDFTLSKHILLE